MLLSHVRFTQTPYDEVGPKFDSRFGDHTQSKGKFPMKKLAVSAVIIGLFLIYCILHAHTSTVAFTPGTARAIVPTATPAQPTGTPPPGVTPTLTPTSIPGAMYKDGAYTGSVADAFWGVIQVKAIISGGKITDVQFLQYPNERSRSVAINQYADPILTSEAIQAQSAQVDIVTGATDSSDAFVQSLSNALSQAQV